MSSSGVTQHRGRHVNELRGPILLSSAVVNDSAEALHDSAEAPDDINEAACYHLEHEEGSAMANDEPEEVKAQFTPTVTESEIKARKFMEGIDQLAATVPWLQGRFSARARRAARHRAVTKAFMHTAAAAVSALDELQSLAKFAPDDARLLFQDDDAFKPVIRKLEGRVRDLKYSMEMRKAALADGTLQIYNIAQALLRDPASAHLGPYVDAMKRDLGRKGRGNKTKKK